MDLLPYGYMSTLLKDEFPTLKVYLYLGASSWFTSLFEPYGKACFLQMLGFYIDANEKCITTIAEFFQIEDNNE